MRSLIINLSVPLIGIVLGWYLIRRNKARAQIRARVTEALEIRYLSQELSAVLTEFSTLHELMVKIQTADESELSDILHVTYNSLAANERSPLLLDGENDRQDFIYLLTRKEQRYLKEEIPYYLTAIFERTWALRDGYELPDDESNEESPEEGESDEQAEADEQTGKSEPTQNRVKCCMCARPANMIVFRYKTGEYIPPWQAFNRSEIPDIMEWEHAWFTACSRGCVNKRMEQARENGEFNDGDYKISVKEIEGND